MLDIKNDGNRYKVTIGVPCNNPLAKGKALTTPLTISFNNDFKNSQTLSAKIKYLQQGIDAMGADERAKLQKDSAITEAFQSSKFEEVFKGISEPDDKTQRAIIDADPELMKNDAFLLMKNTADARINSVKKAREKMQAGEPVFSEEHIKAIQGDIYAGVNELRGVEGSELMHGHIRTGKYKRSMNGDFGQGGQVTFKTAHPEVTEDFMKDIVEFMNSPKAEAIPPVLRAIVAHHLFVQTHPFDDGNGRTSRILYQSVLATADKGEMDLRDVVNISDGYNKGVLQMIYPGIRPDSNGNVDLNRFIESIANMLEKSVDIAIKKAGLPEPELPVSINPGSGGISAG